MKFTPKTKEQLDAADLMPKGEYDAEILTAEETKSKSSGKPMFKVKLGVYDTGGRQQWVFDYIVFDTYKLPSIAKACGLGARYEAGELTAEELQGQDVRVKIGIEPASGEFPAKNKVADYVHKKEESETRTIAPAKTSQHKPDKEELNNVPFN
jgi:hypothetical protein